MEGVFMKRFKLVVIDKLSKLRHAEEDEWIGGGVCHIKGDKGESKLEEISNGRDYIIQLLLSSTNKTLPLHQGLLGLRLVKQLISYIVGGSPQVILI